MAADREHEDPISAILARTRRIAVLAIKTEAQANRPAFYVPQYLVAARFTVVLKSQILVHARHPRAHQASSTPSPAAEDRPQQP